MPWWIWLLLALFMLAMVVSGVVYACLHGYRAFKDVAKLGERTNRGDGQTIAPKQRE